MTEIAAGVPWVQHSSQGLEGAKKSHGTPSAARRKIAAGSLPKAADSSVRDYAFGIVMP
jgi:hypothetical protein